MKAELSTRAKQIFAEVIDAMQQAEELGGPDDYAELMQAIADEANTRVVAFKSV